MRLRRAMARLDAARLAEDAALAMLQAAGPKKNGKTNGNGNGHAHVEDARG